MTRLLALALLLALAACAAPDRMAEPAVVMEAAPEVPSCQPGEGDGIGGTGCPVN
mgnify:CR=1 FL=1|jgi:hypothetical protein